MNLLIIEQKDFITTNTVILNDERYKHIKTILKKKIGDKIKVGLLNSKIGIATVIAYSPNQIILHLFLSISPPPPHPLTLIMALPRPKVFKRILTTIAEIGIKKVYFVHTEKVEKSYWSSPVINTLNINAALLKGLSQAKDTIMPEVHFRRRFKPFIEDELAEIIGIKTAYIAEPTSSESFTKMSTVESVLLIGPEGGFNAFEIALIEAQGVQKRSLGPRVFRVESVIPILSTLWMNF